VIVGEQQPSWVQILGLAVNQALGNIGTTILGAISDEKPAALISDLAAAMKAGTVKSLFVLGGNPAYNAPADLDFAGLLKKVPQSVPVRGRNI
jgi:molybdopterin-containing oxidoreductase family iron-sulfur binding subunit